jgi:putative heme-binding domain-containing protein
MRYVLLGVIGFVCTLVISKAHLASAAEAEPFAEHISKTDPLTPEEERKKLHVPPGFEVQLVAAEPYVRKPININFDDRGRLWVTESIEYPFAAGPGAPHRDTIRILEDTNGDGRADEVTTFADGLNIPIGVLPLARGGAIVYSIPAIYRFDDPLGNDRAGKPHQLYGFYGHRDTHGMTGEFTWGFDGWIYACHGFSNTSEVKGADGSTIVMTSGNIYRFKADGTHVEYFTHGQVNPFGLTLDPLGNLYSCDCHSRPICMLLRGAFYPSFGRPHDGLDFGPEMMTHDHGSTAIAGITYYAADHFPQAYRDTVFVGNVVTNRINHDRLERHGSTYRAIQQPDFLVSDDPWFRPVDIKLGPDGALYVADFYNRIIGHYEVPLTHPGRDRTRGRIWRIVYRGPDGKVNLRKPRPDMGKASVAELIQDLANPNLTVRIKATNQLVERGPAATAVVRAVLQPGSNPFQRMHGFWVLERLHALEDRDLEAAVHDSEAGVRVHALKILAERVRLNEPQRLLVRESLRDGDAFAQRAAAAALGRHPAPANVRPLLDLYHAVPRDDTHLFHVVRMALRDQLVPLTDWHAQLPHSSWTDPDARAVADVARGVPTVASAAYLLGHLQHLAEAHARQVTYVYHVARYGAGLGVETALVDHARGDRAASLKQHVDLFKAIQEGEQARGATLGSAARAWAEELIRQLLVSPREADYVAGIELSGGLRLRAVRDLVRAAVADKHTTEAARVAALHALMSMSANEAILAAGKVLGDASEPFGLREKAAQLLGGSADAAAHEQLLKALETAPERLSLTIAMGLANSRDGAERFLGAIAGGKASAHLLQDLPVKIRMERYDIADLKERMAKLTKDLPPADQKFKELLAARRSGFATAKKDLTEGAKVFEKNCAICHRLANKGAKIGPELDGIGIRGFDRLLEDIIDPNRNVDQAFRLTTLLLKNGQIVSGLVLREEGQVIVLANDQGKEVRVTKDAVEERTVSQLSPMPANLVNQIPEADFYNLVAYLLAQKPSKGIAPGSSASR